MYIAGACTLALHQCWERAIQACNGNVLLHVLNAPATRAGAAYCCQVPEILSDSVLEKMHAPPKPDVPILDPAELPTADGILCGFPTRRAALHTACHPCCVPSCAHTPQRACLHTCAALRFCYHAIPFWLPSTAFSC